MQRQGTQLNLQSHLGIYNGSTVRERIIFPSISIQNAKAEKAVTRVLISPTKKAVHFRKQQLTAMAEEPKKSGEILSFEQEIYMVVNGISMVGKLKFGESGELRCHCACNGGASAF